MKPSPDPSSDAGRVRRLSLLAAAPLAAVAFAVYAFTGLHTDADATAKPVPSGAAPSAATVEAAAAAPAKADEAPVPSEQDAELLAYHSYGG
jgi:hypothetical protein